MTFPHPMNAEDTKAGFANEDFPFQADCDCCDRKDAPLRRCWAYGIETFACEEVLQMTGHVTESIYSGRQAIVPLADVQHIEPWPHNSVPGIRVVTKHTRWDRETGDWANCIWISDPEAVAFRRAWCRYRSELEADTLADLVPAA